MMGIRMGIFPAYLFEPWTLYWKPKVIEIGMEVLESYTYKLRLRNGKKEEGGEVIDPSTFRQVGS